MPSFRPCRRTSRRRTSPPGRADELPATLNRFGVSPTASFELIFNVACGLIELGDVSAAADRLLLAERVGNETLVDEDLGEDEIADELLPVRTQKARVAALRGDVTTAAEGVSRGVGDAIVGRRRARRRRQ